jgi:hypothetical protein
MMPRIGPMLSTSGSGCQSMIQVATSCDGLHVEEGVSLLRPRLMAITWTASSDAARQARLSAARPRPAGEMLTGTQA